MARAAELLGPDGQHGHAVLVELRFLGNADDHGLLLRWLQRTVQKTKLLLFRMVVELDRRDPLGASSSERHDLAIAILRMLHDHPLREYVGRESPTELIRQQVGRRAQRRELLDSLHLAARSAGRCLKNSLVVWRGLYGVVLERRGIEGVVPLVFLFLFGRRTRSRDSLVTFHLPSRQLHQERARHRWPEPAAEAAVVG